MASPAAQHPVRLNGPCICGSQKLFKDCCGYGTAGSSHERRCSSSNPNFFGVSVIEPPCFIQFVGSPPEPTRAPRRLATHPNALAASLFSARSRSGLRARQLPGASVVSLAWSLR